MFVSFFLPRQSTERKHLTHPNTCMPTIQPNRLTPLRVQFHDTQPRRNSHSVMSHSSIVPNLSPSAESSAAWKKKHPSGNFERGPENLGICVSVWVVVREQIARQIKGKSVSSLSGGPSKWRRGRYFCTDKEDIPCSVSEGGFAGELDSKKRAKKWAKCSKRWSSSGQVPPLVPTAKLKPNLLSAPFKHVSQDLGALQLSHPSPSAGTRRGRALSPLVTRPHPTQPHPHLR